MNRRGIVLGLLAGLSLFTVTAQADIVVLSNRGLDPLALSVWATDANGDALEGAPRTAMLEPGELTAIPCDGATQMAFRSGKQEGAYVLDANCAYFFAPNENGEVELRKIGLGDDERSVIGTGVVKGELLDKVVEIPVKILVDDNELAAQKAWEARLRRRLDAASDIFEKYCRVRFKVVAVETWNSNDDTEDFAETLKEFEKQVQPGPARLAIGFTSQYGERVEGAHLGGTRGPLHPFILIREASQGMTEPERLEILLHELGHYLGAVHSPEKESVMRPKLGDLQARMSHFRIGFDPVNTLALNLFADELRARDVQDCGGLSAASKFRLQQIYLTLMNVVPSDPAPRQYLSLILGGKIIEPQVAVKDKELAGATRKVVQAIVQAARENQKRPTPAQYAAEEEKKRLAAEAKAAAEAAAAAAKAAKEAAEREAAEKAAAAAKAKEEAAKKKRAAGEKTTFVPLVDPAKVLTSAEQAGAETPAPAEGQVLGPPLDDASELPPAAAPPADVPPAATPPLGPPAPLDAPPAAPAGTGDPLDFLNTPPGASPAPTVAATPGSTLDLPVRHAGDDLTSYYIREAAKAAQELPPDKAVTAFLLGVGIALDDTDLLVKNPQTSEFVAAVETPAERTARLKVLGEPTMQGRHDLALHFVVSMFMTQFVGPAGADAAGLSKEMLDSTTGSGFSFVDLAADKAGIALGVALTKQQLTLEQIAAHFVAGDFMPTVENLPEGLSTSDFLQQIGSDDDARYQQLIDDITRRVETLPGHRALPAP